MKWGLPIRAVVLIASLMLGASGAQAILISVEPDDFAVGTDLTNAVSGVTLTVEGEPGTVVRSTFFETTDPAFPTIPYNFATTGTLLFGQDPALGPLAGVPVWDEDNHGMLRADFALPTDFVQIDTAFGDDGIGLLQAYAETGVLLAEVTGIGDGRSPDPSARVFQATISRDQPDIAYILAGGQDAEAQFLDVLQFNVVDQQQLPPIFDQTIDSGPGIGSFSRPFEVEFSFDNTPAPVSGGILTVDAFGDLNGLGESVLVFAETSSDEFLGELFNLPPVQDDPIGLIDTLTIPQSLLTGFAADGSISLAMVVPSDNGASFVQFNSVSLRYDVASSVSEPGTLALFGIGLAGVALMRRRNSKQVLQ